jgi:hypothetical protein
VLNHLTRDLGDRCEVTPGQRRGVVAWDWKRIDVNNDTETTTAEMVY